jgi:hypothetical protein
MVFIDLLLSTATVRIDPAIELVQSNCRILFISASPKLSIAVEEHLGSSRLIV